MLYQPMSSPQMTRMFGCGSSSNQLDSPVERAAFRRVVAGDGLGLALALRHQPPLSHAALHQRRRDGLGTGTRQGLVLCRLTGRVGVPGDLQAPGRELLHHLGDVVEQRLRLRLDRRLAGLEVDAVEVVAALGVERLRHRLAAVLLLELLGRLRPCRRGQSRQRQAERQCGGGDRASARGARRSLDDSPLPAAIRILIGRLPRWPILPLPLGMSHVLHGNSLHDQH